MALRKASATWRGNLKDGNGTISTNSGGIQGAYSFSSRFEEGGGTNPEELIAAAHAGCYSMALAHMLSEEGFEPTRVKTEASVKLEKKGDGFEITHIQLDTEAEIDDIEEDDFQKFAKKASKECPVSKALKAVSIDLTAKLL